MALLSENGKFFAYLYSTPYFLCIFSNMECTAYYEQSKGEIFAFKVLFGG